MTQAPIEIPAEFICPITNDIMLNPVFTTSGHTYERSAIEKHFQVCDWDPQTRETCNIHVLTPNWNLKSQISQFIERNRGNLALKDEFWEAVKSENTDEIDRAIMLGMDVDAERGKAVALAVGKRAFATLRHLVECHKAKLALRDEQGRTVLHMLFSMQCAEGHETQQRNAMIRYILERDSSLLSVRYPDGKTLAGMCVVQGNLDLLCMITEFDDDLLIESDELSGQTLMHTAVIHGHVDIVRFLGKFWPNNDATDWVDFVQNTPLHLLIVNPRKISVEKVKNVAECLILELNCDCEYLVNAANKTCVQLAREQGSACAQLFGKLLRKRSQRLMLNKDYKFDDMEKKIMNLEIENEKLKETLSKIPNFTSQAHAETKSLREKVVELTKMVEELRMAANSKETQQERNGNPNSRPFHATHPGFHRFFGPNRNLGGGRC